MSLFTRIKDVVAADLHRLMDEKERKNPTAMLNQFIRNCEGEVKKVEVLIRRQGELASNFNHEKEQAAYMAKKREYQTEIARKAGESDLEKRAHEEAVYYKEQVSRLNGLYEKAKKDESDLQNQLQDMRQKLKEMHHRRLELMGREHVIHACGTRPSSAPYYSNNDPQSYFQDVEKQINRLEEMVHEDYERMSFDMRLAHLERDLKLKEESDEDISEEKINLV